MGFSKVKTSATPSIDDIHNIMYLLFMLEQLLIRYNKY